MSHAMRVLGLIIGLAAAAATGGAPASQSAPAVVPVVNWDQYRIILDRNIFSRDRSLPSGRSRPVFSRPAAPPAGQSFVLTGVAVQAEVSEALFEDSRTGETVWASVGQDVGGGTVVGICLDGVDYRVGDQTRRIALGETLSGVVAELGSSSASSQPAGTTSAPAGEASDLLERMRQRRLQELK